MTSLSLRGAGGVALIGATLALAAPCALAQSNDAAWAAIVKAAQAEKAITLYTTTPQDQVQALHEGFQKKYGVPVEHFFAGGTALTTRFLSEGATKQVRADILMGSDTTSQTDHPEYFQKLSDENFPGYSQMPAAAKLESGLGVSYAASSFAVAFNTQKVSAANQPKTWEDLGDPKWKGQVVLVDPRTSPAYTSALKIVDKLYPGLLAKIVATEPRLTDFGVSAAQQLAAGTGSIGHMVYEVQAAVLIQKGAPLGTAVLQKPEITRRLWASPVTGPHPNAARLYINYLASAEGMKLYCIVDHANKSMLDPTGKATGCGVIAPDTAYLSTTPPTKQDTDDILKALKLN